MQYFPVMNPSGVRRENFASTHDQVLAPDALGGIHRREIFSRKAGVGFFSSTCFRNRHVHGRVRIFGTPFRLGIQKAWLNGHPDPSKEDFLFAAVARRMLPFRHESLRIKCAGFTFGFDPHETKRFRRPFDLSRHLTILFSGGMTFDPQRTSNRLGSCR